MYKKGDKVTLFSGETGDFVRYYGKKVQIRIGRNGSQSFVTGLAPLSVAETITFVDNKPIPIKLSRPVGTLQQKIMNTISASADGILSYRELATACGVPTPRAATCVKSMVERGLIVKTVNGEGKNHYKRGDVQTNRAQRSLVPSQEETEEEMKTCESCHLYTDKPEEINPPSKKKHLCPYKEELYGDKAAKCNCCERCTQECAMNV